MVYEILLLKAKLLLRSFAIKNFKDFIRIITFLFVILSFLLGIYFVFFKIFNYLIYLEDIGKGFVYRISSILFSTIFFLLFTSSIITSISTFFRTPELEFLFSTPMKIELIFLSKFIDNSFFSSWATSIISFPLIFSLGKVFQMENIFIIKWIALFILMIFISTSLGVLIIFLLSDLFKKFSLTFIVTIVFILLLFSFIFFIIFAKPEVFYLPQNLSMDEVSRYLNSLEIEQFKYLPSGTILQIIFNDINAKSSNKNYLLLVVYMVSVLIVLIFLISVYRKKYIGFNLMEKNVKNKRNKIFESKFFLKNLYVFLITKDVIIFLRDPSQWGQSLMFIILLGIYFLSIIRSPIYVKTSFYTYILSFANLGFASYIMATLSVRFIYPLISLEGKTFSIIRNSISVEKYFKSKLIFNFLMVFILGEFLIVLTNIFLKIDLFIVLLSTIITFIFSFGITIINTGFGAILPDFNEKNPSKIASGFGGIVSAISSLVYVGICLSVLSSPVKEYFEKSFKGISVSITNFIYHLIGIVIFTLLIYVLLYILAIKRLKSYNL